MDAVALARAWLTLDPDESTREAVAAALAGDDVARLRDWFGDALAFGTAGMRGALGPGTNRMNRALVRRVSAALAQWLDAQGAVGPVVVGRDARRGSAEFAEDTARVLAAAGRTVLWFDRPCPTPELAHAVLACGACAGVMVTASHNPPEDNGFKVYWADGAQIVPPHDAGISAALAALPLAPISPAPLAELPISPVPPEVREAYLAKVLALRVRAPAPTPLATYTAMHGVGWDLFSTLAARAGLNVSAVPAQRDPDGAFPTVKFPNPEEPGALALAYAHADAIGSALVIANDPDADRLAVAVRSGGQWYPLTGDQVGALLAAELLENGPQDAKRLVATSIVSSRLLSRLAAAAGVAYAETLTGFKWIARAGIPWDAAGGRYVLGYEEALGYAIGPVVRDKDGISAALILVDLAAACASRGEDLRDRLAELYRRHGLHLRAQVNRTLPGKDGAAKIAAILAGLRATPPARVGATAVVAARDWLAASDLPPADVLGYTLADGSAILVRPSGTEPKIKVYFELVVPFAGGDLAAAEAAARPRLDALAADFCALAGL